MSVIVQKKVYEIADEGLHNAQITRVEDLGVTETKFGAKDMVRFVFAMLDQTDKEGKPVESRYSTSKVLGPKSNLGKMLTSLGIPYGDTFDAEDLVGLKCQIVIAHRETPDGTFANITTFIKTKNKTVTSVEV